MKIYLSLKPMMDNEDSFHSACSDEQTATPELKGLLKEVSQLETNSIMEVRFPRRYSNLWENCDGW